MPSMILGAAVSTGLGMAADAISGSKAQKAQTQAADKAAEVQKYMYDTSRADLAPYRKSGEAASKTLSYRMGLGDAVFDRDAARQHIISQFPDLFKGITQASQSQPQGMTAMPPLPVGGVNVIPEDQWGAAREAGIPVHRGGAIHPGNLSRYMSAYQGGR